MGPPLIVLSAALAVKAALNCWTWWEIFSSCNMVMLKLRKQPHGEAAILKNEPLLATVLIMMPSQQVAMLIKYLTIVDKHKVTVFLRCGGRKVLN